MSETIVCPSCGQEILATAKKCKHCGEWFEKQCPQCGEWIKANAMKCKHCGSWLNKFAKERYERENNIVAASAPSKQNEADDYKGSSATGCLMTVELGVLFIIFYYIYRWNWWTMLIIAFSGFILLQIKVLRILYCIVASFVWGVVGLVLAPFILDDSDFEVLGRLANDDYSDYWWVAALFGIISLILHWPAMKGRFNL